MHVAHVVLFGLDSEHASREDVLEAVGVVRGEQNEKRVSE